MIKYDMPSATVQEHAYWKLYVSAEFSAHRM